MRARWCLGWLLTTTAICSAGVASAQDAPTDPIRDALLGELVVTATKQSDTVNRVPLSITAVTQAAIEQQGIRTVQDLARTVPALQVTTSNTPNGSNIAIRGVYSAIGAATTAVYLDEVPLQRRTTLGTFSGSGVIFPQLFDLERVEVLRGPQGSLYGGSAQGGAVRFITPAPSLTTYSSYGRGELSETKDGDLNYELGVAAGGPLIEGRLAFRISAVMRRDEGYIDHVDIYTGRKIGANTNTDDRSALRAVLLWKATERLAVTTAIYASREHHKDADSFWEDVAATTVATTRFNAAGAAFNGSNGPVAFTLPGHTYGPYGVFGPYRTGANCNIGENFKELIAPCYAGAPRTSGLATGSITAEYDLGFADVHFTTAVVKDRNKGALDSSYGETNAYQAGVPFLYTFPLFSGRPVYKNEREGVTEELRVTSKAGEALSWVAGAFYSFQRTDAESHDYTNLKAFAPALRGVSDVILYGAPVAADGDITARKQKLKETEVAVFGEANYFLTPQLKLIAGGRVARSRFTYHTALAGSFFGYAVPTVENGGLSSGQQAQTSFSPKLGAQYNLSPDDSVYVTAAKGFRMGGVNTGPFRFKCASTFTALGISDTPREYDSDSLWSYEVGAKTRTLGGRAQINVSAFYIKWNNVQVSYTLPAPCGFSYTTNAGGAVSQGGDIQARFQLVGGLSASVAASYTDAYYSEALVGPAPTSAIFIRKGDTLPVPKVNYVVGLRYDFTVMGGYAAYARADYQHAGGYKRGFGPGSSSYNVDTYRAEATDHVSARGAVTIDGMELSVFVNNLFNSQDILTRTGGRACANAECTVVRSNNPVFTDTTFRPRTVGVSLAYRH